MKGSNYCLSILISLLLVSGYLGSSCANISSPTGGPQDTIPPKLVRVLPKEGTLNYKEAVIRLEFSEAVTLKNLQSQLLISPRTDNSYKTKVNKNVVEIRFEDPLLDSTTYTLNFRDGIVDITEANPVEDLYLAFSTGPYLDSLKIEGTVRKALTQQPIRGATIALYSANDTLRVQDSKPMYFTTTDAAGNYEVRNLKKGNYLVYAFTDKNSNLTLQTKSENYGFCPDTLALLNTSRDSVNINVFGANAEKPKLLSARPAGNYFDITFNKPMLKYELALEGIENSNSHFIEANKKIRVYPFAMQDSIRADLSATDSLQQTLTQQLYIKFEPSKRAKPEFKVDISPKSGAVISRAIDINLKFSKPVNNFLLDSVRFKYDSLNWEAVTKEDIRWNRNRDELQISKLLNPPKNKQQQVTKEPASAEELARGGTANTNQSVSLIIPANAISSIEGDTLPAQNIPFAIASESQTGIISGVININSNNFILQLVQTSDYKVVRELINKKQYNFRYLAPGEYLIRIIKDRNGNGVWDPGNIYNLQAPEEVFVSPQAITIKANWEIENPEILVQ